ncbi:MAG: prolyl oligopeptidase family serine peptidase [Dysgonomonas sp.]
MTRKTYIKCIVSGIALLFAISATGQKKVLDHSVYDTWKSISDIKVTNDGKYTAAVVREQEGDDHLLIKNLQNQKEIILPRGYGYSVTPDQKYIIAQIKAPFSVTRQAKIKKTAEEKMPKDSLAIIDLVKLSVAKIPNVKTFKLGKDFSEYIAYTIDDSLKIKDKKEPKPYSLILRNLISSKEDTIENVIEFSFSPNGKGFAAILKPAPKDSINKTGVLHIDLSNFAKSIVSEGKTIYKGISLSESGEKLTFLATTDSLKKEIKNYSLFYYQRGTDSAHVVADKSLPKMPNKWNVSENYFPFFSKDEKRLLLGIAPIALPKDTTVPDFEKAQLDIWHWQEPQIQPMQLVQRDKRLKQTYLSYIDLNTNRFYQLASEEMPEVSISDENNGRYAIGKSNLKYEFASQWDIWAGLTNDIWILDLVNNTKKQIKTGLKGLTYLSPGGNYLVWYNPEDRRYYCHSTSSGNETCLTDNLDVNFWDEKTDTPILPSPYGIAAWTENDEAILIYDKYDIWKLDPKGVTTPINLTKGRGREKQVILRYIKTDPESRFIKPKEKLLLSAFDDVTKMNGFYELDSRSILKYLSMAGYSYSIPIKAKDKQVYCYTKSNFNTSPDLYATSNMWKNEGKLSDINPQMKEYNWGTAELVSWTMFDGNTSQGILYKPEDFDPNKKYPVMIYFYEKHSNDLYRYSAPAPSRSIINIPFFCSRGYIVFTPDIHYTTGHPGENAYNAIVSGAEMLIENPWVDKDNMAIQGQSWGGYQTAYLVTRTNMFKAAGAGAPVSNMFSAYGGIRWDSGMSRQFQYEQTQSRIGATIWEAPDLYVENSPIFFADKVETPLLIMHNDKDGAVPWYQGIEYFMALRRLNKPVWLLQYNNEAHNLKERRNAKDLSIRLQQFFDHYLKGDPMPIWMKTGVRAIDKGTTFGFDLE